MLLLNVTLSEPVAGVSPEAVIVNTAESDGPPFEYDKFAEYGAIEIGIN